MRENDDNELAKAHCKHIWKCHNDTLTLASELPVSCGALNKNEAVFAT
jgi:hypothetical protein